MIERYEEYEEFVKHITRTAPLIKTEQLKLMIANYFSQTLESTDAVMFALQRNQTILMSQDGWSMTVGQYIRITGDRFLQGRNSYGASTDEFNRLPNMNDKCSVINKPLSESLWIIADMLPDAIDFSLAASPWAAAFTSRATDDRPSHLYEIAFIEEGYEFTRTEMLKIQPKITSNHVKNGLVRICILEDESYAFRVPYIGFTHIVTIDHSKPTHYRIVETRKGMDRWKDDPYHD